MQEHSAIRPSRRIFVAFYLSSRYGSEYRAAYDALRIAKDLGFDVVVTANLLQNDSALELMSACRELEVVVVPSVVTEQRTLYKYSDFVAQVIWHYRVGRVLRRRGYAIETVWVQNGAAPWLPLWPYLHLANTVIWGPLSGGGAPSRKILHAMTFRAVVSEGARLIVEYLSILAKRFMVERRKLSPRVIPIARTAEARRVAERLFPDRQVDVVPEILASIAYQVKADASDAPRFVWAGQDVPRKNLRSALELFARLKSGYFPAARLDVYGVTGSEKRYDDIVFHGWVRRVDWASYCDAGVLLLSSYREGVPSVVLEAIKHGLLCVSADVGGVRALGAKSVYILPNEEAPSYSEETVKKVAGWIKSARAWDDRFGVTVDHGAKLRAIVKSAIEGGSGSISRRSPVD
jgi:glycosyltransferase involved in cell wall biosynthesis